MLRIGITVTISPDSLRRSAESLLNQANSFDHDKSYLYDRVREAMYAPLEHLPSFLSSNDFRSVIASVRLSEAGSLRILFVRM